MSVIDHVLPCQCGLKPLARTARVSEDAEAIWLECECGSRGDVIEDAFIFDGMLADAIDAWNALRRESGGALQ